MAKIELSAQYNILAMSGMLGLAAYDASNPTPTVPINMRNYIGMFNNAPFANTTTGYMRFSIMKGAVPTDFSTLLNVNSRSTDRLVDIFSGAQLPGGDGTNWQNNSVWNVNPVRLQSLFVAAKAAGTATWFWAGTFNGLAGQPTPNVAADAYPPIQQWFGTIGLPGSGEDLEIPSTSIVLGNPYRVSNLRIRFPTSWEISPTINEQFSVVPNIPGPGQTSGIFFFQATKILITGGADPSSVVFEILPTSPYGAQQAGSVPLVGGAISVPADELYPTTDALTPENWYFRTTFSPNGHIRNFTLNATIAETFSTAIHPDVDQPHNFTIGAGSTGTVNNNSTVTFTNLLKPVGSAAPATGSVVLGPTNGQPASGAVFTNLIVDRPGIYAWQFAFPASGHTLQYRYTSGLSSTPGYITVGQPYTLTFTGGAVNFPGTVIWTLTSKPELDTDLSRPINVPSALLTLGAGGVLAIPLAAPAIPLTPGRYIYTVNFSVTGVVTDIAILVRAA